MCQILGKLPNVNAQSCERLKKNDTAGKVRNIKSLFFMRANVIFVCLM